MLPTSMGPAAIQAAHCDAMSRHNDVYKMKERLLQCYWWSAMDKDIDDHIKCCIRCQIRKKDQTPPSRLQPMPQTTEPNQRIHADLLGPRVTSGRNKKYVLTITDAFTKYVELVAILDKEDGTVAEALFECWFSGMEFPWKSFTNKGREFCN